MHKRIRDDNNDADDVDDTASASAVVFQNYALIHVHVMRFLPSLADRARLACVTRNMRRYCTRHDVALKQMWTTWAVPNLSLNVRTSLLLPSGLMACIRWAWDHDVGHGTKYEHYAIILSKLGHIEGVLFSIDHAATALERRQLLIQCVMQMFHSEHWENAIQLYEKHVKPLEPTPFETSLCMMASLYACSDAIEARTMAWKPGMRHAEVRLLGLKLGLCCRNPAILEYHFNAIANSAEAIRALACAVNAEHVGGVEYIAILAKAKVRAEAANISMDVFWVQWLEGMQLNPDTFEFRQ